MKDPFLKRLAQVSAAVILITLAVAFYRRAMDGVVAQIFLTGVAGLFGAVLMHVQLFSRTIQRTSRLCVVGIAVILVSEVAFLTLVWTQWKTATAVWRLWWITMNASVISSHLVLLRRAAGGKWRGIEAVAAGFVLWAGGMILYMGVREDMLAKVPAAYWWVGAPAAAGTVGLSLVIFTRWLLRTAGAGPLSRRSAMAGVILSHLVVAFAAFYGGRATAERAAELDAAPHAMAAAMRDEVRDQVARDAYVAQSEVATFIGDTRIVDREPYISLEQIDALEDRLMPGDILIERRNWYLSNPCLPGFWPHAALYVGTIEDLRELGVADAPEVVGHMNEYLSGDADGGRYTVIEAVSEGVIMNTLAHSMHADYVAVLRPRVSPEAVASAIVRAFGNLGKPYDFNFDFDDTSKLVCTQVVYLSYLGSLDLETREVMGRITLPALDIAAKYVSERGREDRQLDLVLFLDAVPSQNIAREASEEEFCESIKRPRVFVER